MSQRWWIRRKVSGVIAASAAESTGVGVATFKPDIWTPRIRKPVFVESTSAGPCTWNGGVGRKIGGAWALATPEVRTIRAIQHAVRCNTSFETLENAFSNGTQRGFTGQVDVLRFLRCPTGHGP